MFKTVGKWIDDFFQWLERRFKKDAPPEKPEQPESKIQPRHLTMALIAMTVLLLGFIIFFRLRRPSPEVPAAFEPGDVLPDLEDETLPADSLRPDQWGAYAGTLMEEGDFRSAIRALYLGTLAYLADRNLISIARHKSNREYKEEFGRRAHTGKEATALFEDTVKIVDRVWYGMYGVNQQMVEAFSTQQKRIKNIAG